MFPASLTDGFLLLVSELLHLCNRGLITFSSLTVADAPPVKQQPATPNAKTNSAARKMAAALSSSKGAEAAEEKMGK